MPGHDRSGAAVWLVAVAVLVAVGATAAVQATRGDRTGPVAAQSSSWASPPPSGAKAVRSRPASTPAATPTVTMTGPPLSNPTPAGRRWSTPPRASGTTAGLTWATPSAPPYLSLFAVPNGYVLVTAADPPVVWTSPDGVAWTSPPDPAIFVNESEAPFAIDSLPPARGPAGFLLGTGSTTVWLSRDGIHWRLHQIASATVALGRIRPARSGYLATETESSDQYWTSADGLTWHRASSDAWRTMSSAGGGGLLLGGGEGCWSWWSADDGVHWQPTVWPPKGRLLYGVARLGATYLSVWSLETGVPQPATAVFGSTDLTHWRTVPQPPFSSPYDLAVLDGRAFVLENEIDPNGPIRTGRLWTSVDGLAWTQVVDGEGRAVMGTVLRVAGGRLLVFGQDDMNAVTIRYVGTPSPVPLPPLTPRPSPIVWPTDPPASTPEPTPMPMAS